MSEIRAAEPRSLKVHVENIARAEGEGRLDVIIEGGEVRSVVLDIKEPPRFFEAFMVGRHYSEVPDIVARICGICPVSHQMAGVAAVEDALGVVPSVQTRDLRKLLALSQWIQSHALHIYLLALPDYLGAESVLALPPETLPVVKRALRLKRLGNDLTKLIGGREVHPVTVAVGGFTAVPPRSRLAELVPRLEAARQDVWDTVELVASLAPKMPRLSPDQEQFALTSDSEYALSSAEFASTGGLRAPLRRYRRFVEERHVPPSNALRSFVDGESFLVGPLARVNINAKQLHPRAREAVGAAGMKLPCANPYASMAARAVELVHSVEESLEIIRRLPLREERRDHAVKAGEGFGGAEAPRGLLYHNYVMDANGLVERAQIVSPTAHNSANMEDNLRRILPQWLSLPEEQIALNCEMLVRAYDPCFSCSAHFLRLNLERR